jgi:hypothetical protein
MNVLLSRLNEQQRRWYVALESKKIGHGGDQMLSEITGMDVETIRRCRRELDEDLSTPLLPLAMDAQVGPAGQGWVVGCFIQRAPGEAITAGAGRLPVG